MPELPEVETTVSGITPHISNQNIVKVIVRNYKLRWPIPKNINKTLISNNIKKIQRRAKYILIETNTGTIIIHLGMSGHLKILEKPSQHGKHDHVDIIFSNNKILRMNDPRRFGAFLWTSGDPQQHALLKNLGVEPLTKSFTGQYLFKQAQGRNIPIKTFLMNNKIVTGVGNIYATEVLFAAGANPLMPAKNITKENANKLVKLIKQILKSAIKQGGTTLKDFFKIDGKPGYFVNKLKAYGRAGLPCIVCEEELKSIQIGQRATVYCSKCQNLS